MFKSKKILAGFAAAALALSAASVVSFAADEDSDSEVVTGTAGIAFQTNTTWNYRNAYGSDGETNFPNAGIGVQGGAYGVDSDANCGDTAIYGDGTYTVTIDCSGDVDGVKWSMANNYDSDGNVTATTDEFNMLLIATDIACEVDDDGNAIVNGNVVTCSDVQISWTGENERFDANLDVAIHKSDAKYLTFEIINVYDSSNNNQLTDYIIPNNGTLSITFTLSGLDGESDENVTSASGETSTSSESAESTESSESSVSSTFWDSDDKAEFMVETLTDSSGNVVYSFSVDLTDYNCDFGTTWENALTLGASVFTYAKAGDTITICYTVNDDDDYQYLYLTDSEGNLLPGAESLVNEFGCFELDADSTYLVYTFTEEDIEALQSGGLIIGGYNITATSIASQSANYESVAASLSSSDASSSTASATKTATTTSTDSNPDTGAAAGLATAVLAAGAVVVVRKRK